MRVQAISLFWLTLLLMCGCKKPAIDKSTEGAREAPKQAAKIHMKTQEELQSAWDKLESETEQDPELWKKVAEVYERDVRTSLPSSKRVAWQQLYQVLGDPNANPAAARNVLQVFIDANATEVVRESVINPRRGVPGWELTTIASQALGTVRDKKAVPYLIQALIRNNYPQPGSESATLHSNMKRKLLGAIQRITGLDAGIDKIDVNDPEQVERVISMAKDWAKQHNIQLLDK